MKKKVILLLLMLFPSIVLADAYGPINTVYKAVITNPNGVTCTFEEGEDTFAYGEEITVYANVVQDDKDMLMIESKSSQKYYMVGKFIYSRCYIPETDAEPLGKENDAKLTSEYFVFKEGAYIYKAPNEKYGKASETMIPVGTIIKTAPGGDMESWAYTEYNGITGYVFIWQDEHYGLDMKTSLASIYKGDKKVLFFEDTKLLDLPNGEENGVVIPSGSEITPKAYKEIKHEEGKNCYYYETEYGNGWTCERKYETIGIKNGIVIKDSKVYQEDEIFNGENTSIGQLKKHEIISTYVLDLSYYTPIYYTISENIEGYFYENNIILEQEPTTINNGIYQLYDSYRGKLLNKDIVLTDNITTKYYDSYIPVYYHNEECTETWYYLESENAWITIEEGDCASTVVEPEIEPEITPEEEENQETENNEETPKKMNTMTLLLIILGGTVCLSATTVVVIILINKKKNKKVEKVAEETKTPEENVTSEEKTK